MKTIESEADVRGLLRDDWDEAFKSATGGYPDGSRLIGRLTCVGKCGSLARDGSNYCQRCWNEAFPAGYRVPPG